MPCVLPHRGLLDVASHGAGPDFDERSEPGGYGAGVWSRSELRQRCEWRKPGGSRCTLASLPRGRWCWMHADLAEADRYPGLVAIDDPSVERVGLADVARYVAGESDDTVITWIARFEQGYRYLGLESRGAAMREPAILTRNRLHDAFIAGLAEYLSWHDGLELPAWTLESERRCGPGLLTLVRPKEDASWSRARHVPAAFKMRGVYMSDQALEKV